MTIAEISVHDLAALGPEAQIVDVREPDEWEQGHIGHATLVPLGTVAEHAVAFGSPDGEPTYVVCRSGGRSGRACEFLGAQGRDVVNVAGGMIAWAAAGLDVVVGPGTAGG